MRPSHHPPALGINDLGWVGAPISNCEKIHPARRISAPLFDKPLDSKTGAPGFSFFEELWNTSYCKINRYDDSSN